MFKLLLAVLDHFKLSLFSVSVGQLAGRGCSSKEKLYREHCEVHEMDGLIEKFCYCSFNLCNSANITKVSFIFLFNPFTPTQY